jgi:hypothetical protein
MSTAAAQLEKPGVRQAFVVLIEGHDVAYTDSADFAAIQSAWTGEGYTFRPGLELGGSISRQLDLLGFKIEPVGFSFDIVDGIPWSSSSSLAKLFADKDESASSTVLTSNSGRDDTVFDVRDTVNPGFASSGTVHVGHERVDYSGKTATTLTGLTRGKFPVVPGKTTWAHTHRLPTDGDGPEVSSSIRVWKNRMVAVYVVAIDPDTGTWTTKTNSLAEIVGYVEDWKYGDGRWSIDCVSIEKRMQGQLLRSQYKGTVRKGFRLFYDSTLNFSSTNGNATWTDSVSITIAAGHYTIDSLIAEINAALQAETLTHEASLSLVGNRTRLSFDYTTASAAWVTFTLERADNLSTRVMDLLGWPSGIAAYGNGVSGAGVINVDAPNPAVSTEWSPFQGTLEIENYTGTFENQSSDDLPTWLGTVHGYLQISEFPLLWLCSFNALSNTATWKGSFRLDGTQADAPPWVPPGLAPTARRLVGEDADISVKQVWIVKGSLARVLLRMLLSTGTEDYNDATYDKWPVSMSLGIPSTIVDISAIEALSEQIGDAAKLFQVLLEPESAADHIESLMQTFGFHLVWARTSTSGQYKLTPIIPTVISGLSSQFTLDGSNTGSDHRTRMESGAQYVKNRAVLLYNRNTESGEFEASITAENMTSQSEHDEPDGFEHRALALYDYDGKKVGSWVANVAAPTMAYFGRPVRTFVRSGSRALWNLFVGAVVTLTDPEAPSDTDGTYGVTAVKGWVIGISKNFETMELDEIRILVPKGRAFRLAPTAMLDYSRGDKGYDSGNTRLYCRDNEFTPAASGSKDIDFFYADDTVDVVEVDPANPASPTTWLDVPVTSINSASGYIQLGSGLAAFDSTRRYYVILSTYASVDLGSPGVRSLDGGTNPVAYLADSSATVLADSGDRIPGVLWSSFLPSTPDVTTAPTGDEHYRRPWNEMDDAEQPLSSHMLRDWVYAVNNLYRHVTNQHPIFDCCTSAITTTETTYALCGGPWKIRVPPGATTLNLIIFAKANAAGTATFRVNVAGTCPTFEGDTSSPYAPENPVDVAQTESSTTSTTLTTVTVTVGVSPNVEGYAYLWIEMKSGAHGSDYRGATGRWAERSVS